MIRDSLSGKGLEIMREKYYEHYESYEHIPLKKAEGLFEQGQNQWYRVETINWTLATEDKKKVRDTVHHNFYK